MSLFVAASRRVSIFRGISAALAVLLALLLSSHAPMALAADAPADAAATAQTAAPVVAAPVAVAPSAVAVAVPPVMTPGAQAAMSITWPMPGFGPGRPPQIIEPVAMVACRQCRESCFRDYGAQCNDESCRRALPFCMRNCWQAVCR